MVTRHDDSLDAWWQRQSAKSWSAFTPLFALLACMYHAAVTLRCLYFGKKGAKRLPGYVVSIGNLSLGGTGKTPAVFMIAKWALRAGHHVAVLSRGYGGQYKESVFILSNGIEIYGTSQEGGDEPFLLAKSLPGVPIILAKDRYQAGMEAYKRFGSRFFVLDDGFQHQALGRDLDILLLDGRNPFGNGRLFPWGPLREPIGHMRRADTIILTRTDEDSRIVDLIGFLEGRFPGKPIFTSDHIPDKLFLSDGSIAKDPQFLQGKKVVAFAGIARPDEFRDTLQKMGARVLLFKAFKDHHPFRIQEMAWLLSESERLGAQYLLTTEKDWVRLDDETKRHSKVGYLTIRFALPSEEAFFSFLKRDFQKWNAHGEGASKRRRESRKG
jgi:tetraacyldisaccharide 4'-kinase